MLQILFKGGLIMIPLGVCSVIALAVFIEKWMVLARIQHHVRELGMQLKALMRAGGRESYLSMLNASQGPLANIVRAALGKAGRADRVKAMEDRAEIELFYIDSKLGLLATIASVGPLLGFLGTVIGIIQAFQNIEMAGGNVNPSLLAGGIWEALMGSAGGLFIGIPTIFAYNFLLRKIERIVTEMKLVCIETVDFLGA
jgi:biopolymer transport protein ExbB